MFDRSFLDGCVYGMVNIEDLDAYVEYWHTHDTNNTLQEFLGMSPYEYGEWLKYGDSVIRDILHSRVDGVLFEEYNHGYRTIKES